MDAGQGPAPPLEGKTDDSPEEKLKLFEKKVTELIEESCLAASRGELQLVSSYYCCFFLFFNFMLRYKWSRKPIYTMEPIYLMGKIVNHILLKFSHVGHVCTVQELFNVSCPCTLIL